MVPRLLGTSTKFSTGGVVPSADEQRSTRNVNAAGQEHKHHYSCRLAITDKHTP